MSFRAVHTAVFAVLYLGFALLCWLKGMNTFAAGAMSALLATSTAEVAAALFRERRKNPRPDAQDRRRYRVYWEPRITRLAWAGLILAALVACWMVVQLMALSLPQVVAFLTWLSK